MRLVSVMGAEARLCDEWFERELKPLLESHREQATASLKRKAGGLREAVLNTLKARLQGQVAGADSRLPGASRRGYDHAAQSRRVGGGC